MNQLTRLISNFKNGCQNAIQILKVDFNDKLKELKSKLVASIDNANPEVEQISLAIERDPLIPDRIRYHLDTEEPLCLLNKI